MNPENNPQPQDQNNQPTHTAVTPQYTIGSAAPGEADNFPQKRQNSPKLIIIAIIIVVSLIGITLAGLRWYGVNQTNSSVMNGSREDTYTDAKGFSITPPMGWQKLDCANNYVCFSDPNNTSKEGKEFHSIMSVGGIDLQSKQAQSITNEQTANGAIEYQSKSFENFTLLQNSTETVNGIPAVLIQFRGSRNNQDITSATLFIKSNDVAYTVNFIALTSAWSKDESEIISSINSFTLSQ